MKDTFAHFFEGCPEETEIKKDILINEVCTDGECGLCNMKKFCEKEIENSEKDCENCDGTGIIIIFDKPETCHKCNGTGIIEREKQEDNQN